MINVIGLGYIGLPTALMLASRGYKVIGTDYNKELVSKLKNEIITFEEKGLIELFSSALLNGITFSDEYQKTSTYIVAVPTPYDPKTKKIDAKYVISAVDSVLDICEDESLIIIESTISPGTIDKIIKPRIKIRLDELDKKVHIIHAPERIIPGNMIYELEHNSRTIGADSKEIAEKVKELYSVFCKGEIILTDIRSAEMTKVIENTYRDVNIAFANELAKICRTENMDVYEIIKIANKHPRVNILQPGPGVGGHCISVDPWFLVGDYPELTKLITAARYINDSMPEFVIERIHTIMEENNIEDISKVGIYGLTYKENVDDIRESPTLQLLENLNRHLCTGIKVYDPYIHERIVTYQVFDFSTFINESELIIIMVAHQEIINNMKLLESKLILDTRNICHFPNVYKL